MELLARTLEDARKIFLERHGYLVEHSSRERLYDWIKHASEDPVLSAVRLAMVRNRLDDKELERELHASLKFRCLAGMLTLPVEYPDPSGTHGVCGRERYDPETQEFRCVVEGNQEQADAWHAAFGHGPTCPFWVNPNPTKKRDDELQRLLREEEKSLEEAFRILGLDN